MKDEGTKLILRSITVDFGDIRNRLALRGQEAGGEEEEKVDRVEMGVFQAASLPVSLGRSRGLLA